MISVMTIVSGLISLVPITGICLNEKTALLLDSYERDVKPLVLEYEETNVQMQEGDDLDLASIHFKSTETIPPRTKPVQDIVPPMGTQSRKQRPQFSKEVKDLADLNSVDLSGLDMTPLTKKVGASGDLDLLNSDLSDILNN